MENDYPVKKKDGEKFYFKIYNYVEIYFAFFSNIYFNFAVYS